MEEIFVPALGMAMEEAVLVEWLKEPGDQVDIGDDVAMVETDKTTIELSATTAGRLAAHRVEAGTSVAVGTTVTVVLADGEQDDLPPQPPSVEETTPLSPTPAATPPAVAEGGPQVRQPHRLSPRQRMAARTAEGNGAAGPATGDIRAAIARQVSRSWAEIPHFAVARDIEADGILSRLAGDRDRDPDSGVRLTLTDVLLAALASAADAADVGLAVATGQGVLIPVLSGLAGRPLAEIAEQRRAAVIRAREHRSSPADRLVPAITLSNLGTHGVSWFTGIIPMGQKGLLTTGAVESRPVAVEGRLEIRDRFTAILNVDHREWDGADAARLLERFADHIRAYGAVR